MAIISADAKRIIEENPVAFATVDSKGNPNVIAVAFVKVIGKNKVLITDNYMKQTRENLILNDNVCLAVWSKDWNGYKLLGTAEYHSTGKWKKHVEKMPENDGLSAKGAILVTVSQIIKLG